MGIINREVVLFVTILAFLLSTRILAIEDNPKDLPVFPERSDSVSAPKELRSKIDEIKNVAQDLNSSIDTAIESFRDIGTTNPTEREQIIAETFKDFQNVVLTILKRVGPNGELTEAFDRARESTKFYYEDMKRKPDNYLNKQENLARLQLALDKYDNLGEQLINAQANATNEIYHLEKQQDTIIDAIRIREIEGALNQMDTVITGLRDLTQVINGFQYPEEAIEDIPHQ